MGGSHLFHHADDAAVTKNRGRPARMPPDDFKQARLDPGAELNARFAVGHRAQLDFVQPVVRMNAEFFAHFLPVKSVQSPKSTSRNPGRKVGAGAPFLSSGASVCWTRFIGLA